MAYRMLSPRMNHPGEASLRAQEILNARRHNHQSPDISGRSNQFEPLAIDFQSNLQAEIVGKRMNLRFNQRPLRI